MKYRRSPVLGAGFYVWGFWSLLNSRWDLSCNDPLLTVAWLALAALSFAFGTVMFILPLIVMGDEGFAIPRFPLKTIRRDWQDVLHVEAANKRHFIVLKNGERVHLPLQLELAGKRDEILAAVNARITGRQVQPAFRPDTPRH